MTRHAVTLLALAASLAGCIPAKFSGYRPTGPGSREGGYCVAGIRDRLRVPAIHGVEILLHAEEDGHDHTILLEVTLVVPDAAIVQLGSTEVLVRSPDWAQAPPLVIQRITGGASREHGPLAVLTGSSQDSMGTFTLWFLPGDTGTLWRTGMPAARSFAVSLPAMTVDGVPFQADVVTFEAYSEWGVYTCAQ